MLRTSNVVSCAVFDDHHHPRHTGDEYHAYHVKNKRKDGRRTALFTPCLLPLVILVLRCASPLLRVEALLVEALDEAREAGLHSCTQREMEELTIAELELLASTYGLLASEDYLPDAVVSFTDNVFAQAAMRAPAPKAELMQKVVEALTEWLMQRCMAEAVRRVTSQANLWADLGSRGDVEMVLQQAAALGMRTRVLDVPGAWRDTEAWLLPAADVGE